MRRMQTLGRLGRAPVEFRKYPRGVIDGLPLAFDVRHEVFIEIEQRLHVKPALDSVSDAKLPAEMHQTDAALDPQPRLFQTLTSQPERRSRGNRVIHQNDQLGESALQLTI